MQIEKNPHLSYKVHMYILICYSYQGLVSKFFMMLPVGYTTTVCESKQDATFYLKMMVLPIPDSFSHQKLLLSTSTSLLSKTYIISISATYTFLYVIKGNSIHIIFSCVIATIYI